MAFRVKKRKEYWWDIIFGGLITFIIMAAVGYIILKILNLLFLEYYYYVICVLSVLYSQWNDDNYKSIATEFSKAGNSEMILKTLDSLNWNYKVYPTGIQVTDDHNGLKFLNICIIPSENTVYYNIQYHPFVLLGRMPFFFGILTIARRKFCRGLTTKIARDLQAVERFECNRSIN